MLITKGVYTIMRHSHLALCALFAAVLLLGSSLAARADSVPRMSTEELKSRLGDAALTVLDVRADWDWNQSAEKITGAERVNPAAVDEWAGNYPKARTLVLYCS
jgi:hypothetical protein